ncbi:MAG: hypothetical protein K2Z81_12740, partial [Cyanobacteria bacterium]|nr:hypothetical protein [Cyanobacteriota bacterium]
QPGWSQPQPGWSQPQPWSQPGWRQQPGYSPEPPGYRTEEDRPRPDNRPRRIIRRRFSSWN